MTEHRPGDSGGEQETVPSTGEATGSASGDVRAGTSDGRPWWRVALVVAVVLLLVVLVERGVRLQSDTGADEAPAAEPVATRLADGISFGTEGPVVELYLDFYCEFCGDMESRVGNAIAEMVRADEITLVLRPVKFISPFSARAAAAMSCSVDSGRALAYQRAVFANARGSLSPERLVEIARAVGIEDPGFEECIEARETKSFVNATTDAARDRGVLGVPAVVVDGELVDPAITETPEDFRAAIDELAG